MVDYKIIGFNPESGQLKVEYGPELNIMVIDVPIVDGLFMAGEELISYIQSMIPTWHLERLEKLAAGIPNADSIAQLVQPASVLPDSPVDPQELANQQMWAQVEFEKKIAKALVKFGVLETDPMAIPVSAQ